jgi:hypothetical protein
MLVPVSNNKRNRRSRLGGYPRNETATLDNTHKSEKIRLLIDRLGPNSGVDTEVPCMACARHKEVLSAST